MRLPNDQIAKSLILFALSPWLSSGIIGARDNPTATPHAVATYDQEVYLGLTDFRYPAEAANCVVLGASFSSDSFFEGLALTDTPRGPQFHRHGQLVETFPDTLLVKASALLILEECNHAPRRGLQNMPTPGLDLEDSLRFEVAFVKGLSVEPAEVISTHARKVSFTELGPQKWNYEILVRTKAAAITDQVKLTVYSVDGQFLGRMIGGLETPVSRRLYSTKRHKP
jgi:predicted metal-binding protein